MEFTLALLSAISLFLIWVVIPTLIRKLRHPRYCEYIIPSSESNGKECNLPAKYYKHLNMNLCKRHFESVTFYIDVLKERRKE